MKKILVAFLCLCFLVPFSQSKFNFKYVYALSQSKNDEILNQLNGKWEGNYPGNIINSKEANENVVMNFVNEDKPKLLLSFKQSGLYYWNIESWEIENESLVFSFNDDPWKAIVILSFKDKNTLEGFYIQYGKVAPVVLSKISDEPENKEFYQENMIEGHNLDEWVSYLKEGKQYKNSNEKIPYKYDLGKREEYKDIIEKYNLDELVKDKDDTEKMISLLYFVSDNFKHNGSIGMPEEVNAHELIKYYEQKGGLNCRGLSVLLSELLRAYDIPAKHIVCMPVTEDFIDCHVVVHAYSEDLKKWIMLDPTHKLYIKDEKGNFMNLPELRNYLSSGKDFTANKEAGWNENEFDKEYYRMYMAKNTYRFQCATDFYYGADYNKGKNVQNMLVPFGYNPKEKNSKVTNDFDEFWKIP